MKKVQRILRSSTRTKEKDIVSEGELKDDKELDDERNPFNIPPNRMTQVGFEMQNPFLHIIDDSILIEELEDKVRDGKAMEDAALREAMCEMVNAAWIGPCAFKNPTSEVGGRPQHIALASGFWLITKPYEDASYPTVQSYTEACKSEGGIATTSDNQCGLMIKLKQIDAIRKDSNESLNIRQEGDDGEFKAQRISYDFNFLVYDKNIQGPDKKVTTLIVDATSNNLSLCEMLQVSSYGTKYAIRNMAKGRFEPIYLELWGEDRWRYGILYPSGTVCLENGSVVETHPICTAIGVLEGVLTEKMKIMRSKFPEFKGTFPDGSYVQGTLYVSQKKFMLPSCLEPQIGQIQHAQLFFQSKIRIIAGDTALNWNKEDVKNRISLRKESILGRSVVQKAWIPIKDNESLKRRRL